MESISTSRKSLDELLRRLTRNFFYKFYVIERLKHNPDWIEDNLIKQCTSDAVFSFIHKAKTSCFLRFLLPYIVDSIPEEAIDEIVFSELYSFRYNIIRERIIISLSHKHLPYYMVKALCETNLCFECYFELAYLVYSNDSFSADEFRITMQFFISSPYGGMLSELTQELKTLQNPDEEKLIVLQEMIT